MIAPAPAIETINAVELRPEHAGHVVEYQTVTSDDDGNAVPITVIGTLVAVENGQTFGRGWSRVTVQGTVLRDGLSHATEPTVENVLGGHRTVRLYRAPKAQA
ncbi:hypothetical protein [Streptomyces sp. NPDC093261]|uniref:hypothetical protein n=1 Tax=Streptomyces sp. NPDC093261 TaxID=3366037 RepID=UPI00381A000F